MRPENNIKKLIENAKVKIDGEVKKASLDELTDELKKSKIRLSAQTRSKAWRIIMNNKMTRLAAAAMITVVAIIALNTFNAAPAWADVVKAFNKATSVHIVKTDTLKSKGIVRRNESWVKDQTLFKAQSLNWCVIDDGRQVLTLYKDQRIAHLRDSMTPYWDYTPLILKVFKDSKNENGITVAMLPEESDGKTHVYEISFRNYWQGKAWVNVESNLPMRIKGQEFQGQGQARDFEIAFDYTPIADEIFDTTIPPDFKELPRIANGPVYREREKILFGSVIDQQGNPVVGAEVFASYAQFGKTDEKGNFALTISPDDSSNSIGEADFPMFVWAYKESDPENVAWTLIRHPEAGKDYLSIISVPRDDNKYKDEIKGEYEKTHQGVELTIKNEQQLDQYLGQSGKVEKDSKVHDIVLVMSKASTVSGRITNESGQPVSNATVWIKEFVLKLETNEIIISNLNHEWKSKAFTVTDNDGYYEITNLPSALNQIELEVSANGYATKQKEFESVEGIFLEKCNIQLAEGESEAESQMTRYFGEMYTSRNIEESKRFSDVKANGFPVKGVGNSIKDALPADLLENLVLYYSFNANDDNSVITDISGNGLNGQAHGATLLEDEILGGTMSFDGNDDHIALPDISLKEFTFSAWVKTKTDDLNNRRIFLLDGGYNYYSVQGNSGQSLGMCNTTIEVNEYDLPLKVDKWTHLTTTYAEDQVKIYINGILTEMANGDFTTGGIRGKAYIGFSGHTGDDNRYDGDYCWHGQIDEVALFNRTLKDEEVMQLFNMTGHVD